MSFFYKNQMIFCVSTFSNKSLIEEATKCLFRTSLKSTHSVRMCFTVTEVLEGRLTHPQNANVPFGGHSWHQSIFLHSD